MRALCTAVVLAAFVLSGCGQQSAPPPQAVDPAAANAPPAVPDNVPAVRGQVFIEGLRELPRRLELRLRLLDTSDPSVPPPVVAERTEPAPAGLPYRYALPYEPARIVADRRYGIEASLLTGGVVLYVSPKPVQVLTLGAGSEAQLPLARSSATATDAAPADVLKQQFDELEASIGGMRRLVGERINADVTIGWDAFAEDTDVRFARENVDYGAAGTASFRFAYKDGEPWVVAREQGGVLSLLGWGGEGEVVLNRRGDSETLDESAIADLRGQAEILHRIVKARAEAE